MNTKNNSTDMAGWKNGIIIILVLLCAPRLSAQTNEKDFKWPDGSQMAVKPQFR